MIALLEPIHVTELPARRTAYEIADTYARQDGLVLRRRAQPCDVCGKPKASGKPCSHCEVK